MARVHVVLAVLAVPSVAAAQANQADFQARFDRALVVFNSPRQPEAIPQFSQLIDDLRAPAQSIQRPDDAARPRAAVPRAGARKRRPGADADADLRLIREVAPTFRLTDPGLSPSLVNRFNAMVGPNAQQPQPARATAARRGEWPKNALRLGRLSVGAFYRLFRLQPVEGRILRCRRRRPSKPELGG
jgi:hypothetical protein